MEILSLATSYIRNGWSVFPVVRRGKRPATPRGFKDASREESQIKAWFSNDYYNIGVATGEASGIVVVDIDGEEGEAEWRAVASRHEPIYTRESRTGGGGRHIFFRYPGIHVGNRTPFEHIHIRGDGGYIVAPPSIHPSGARYEWQNELPIAPMPIWLLNMLVAEGAPSDEATTNACADAAEPVEPANPASSFGFGGDSRTRYASAALKSAADRVASAREGARNNTLNQETFSLAAFVRDGLLSRSDVEQAMGAAARLCGLPEDEARRTIASALDAGIVRSRRVIDLRGPDLRSAGAERSPLSETETGERGSSEPTGENSTGEGDEKRPATPTHDDIATAWWIEHPDTRYGMGSFYRYRAGHWVQVPDGEIEKEIYSLLVAAKKARFRPTSAALASVKKLASVACTVPDELWDANYDLIVCANGTLDVSNMVFRDHDPQDYQTGALPFDYDPTADCPTLKRVLQERIPYAAEFLQEFAGYCLTTDTSLETALWLYGPRASGKSTIIEALEVVLGKRAGLLGLADLNSNRFALADVPGKTLLFSTEQPSSYVGCTHILNQIISGESIVVERKYRDPYRFKSRAKIIWAMNELPRIGSASDGIWRRVKVIEFPQSIANPDPRVKEAIKREGPGILNWALEGLVRLRGRGRFDVPARVTEAIAQYARANDIPSVFVEDCCLVGEQYETGSNQLYQAYKQWCADNGHKPQSSTTIADDWERLGFKRVSRGGRRIWQGVGLRV